MNGCSWAAVAWKEFELPLLYTLQTVADNRGGLTPTLLGQERVIACFHRDHLTIRAIRNHGWRASSCELVFNQG